MEKTSWCQRRLCGNGVVAERLSRSILTEGWDLGGDRIFQQHARGRMRESGMLMKAQYLGMTNSSGFTSEAYFSKFF